MENKSEKKMLGILAIILGILALLGSWIPILNNLSFIIAIPALILGFTSLIINRKNNKMLSIIGTILSIIAIAIVLVTQSMYGTALDKVSKSVDNSVKKVDKKIKDDQKKAEESFKWKKSDYDGLIVGDSFSGAGGTNYNDVLAKFGEPKNKSESTSGDYTSMYVTYDNMGASDYKSVNLDFVKQEDGNWLLSHKNSNGLE